VDTGSREENASNKNLEPRSDGIGTGKALGQGNLIQALNLNRDIRGLDALDAGFGHVGPGLGE
jgi:hypothetical protein